jgi:hypothetical protein
MEPEASPPAPPAYEGETMSGRGTTVVRAGATEAPAPDVPLHRSIMEEEEE